MPEFSVTKRECPLPVRANQDALLTAILSYTDPVELQARIDTAGLTFDDEIAIIVGIIRDSQCLPSERLAAIKLLDALRMRALRLSGQIVTAKQQSVKTSPDGHYIRTTMALQRVLERTHNPFAPSKGDPNAAESEASGSEVDSGQGDYASGQHQPDGERHGPGIPGTVIAPSRTLDGGIASDRDA